MIASLPMYWRAETAAAWQRLWSSVRAALPHLPELTPPEALPEPWTEHWLSPDLALSMTCGLPFRTVLKDKVTYVGTLSFGLNAAPGQYYSRVIARNTPLRPGPLRVAINGADSQSGWAAVHEAGPRNPSIRIGEVVVTGSHAASLAAVATGAADIAWLDAVTWRLLKRSDPNAARVVVAGRSPATPGLPLIAAKGTDPAPLRAALRDAVLAMSDADCAAMAGLQSFVVLDPAAYLNVPLPPPVSDFGAVST